MKKVAAVGITEIALGLGDIPLVMGNELQFHGPNGVFKFSLPSKPKWYRGEDRKIMKIPKDIRMSVPLYEDAVNPYLQLESKKSTKELAIIRIFIHADAVSLLQKEDVKSDKEMLKKCKWVCKIFRTQVTVLDADERPCADKVVDGRVIKGHKGRVGACVFQQLGMIGG